MRSDGRAVGGSRRRGPAEPEAPSALEGDAAELRVRRATAGDVDRAAPLFDAYRQFYGAPPDLAAARRFLAARLASNESVVLLAVAEAPYRKAAPSGPDDAHCGEAEDVVGLAQLYRSFSSVALGETVILNDLFVVPARRARGVAGRLVDAAAFHASRVGAVRLELATQCTNHAALRLYRNKGFVADTEFTHLSLAIDPTDAASPREHGD